MDVYARMSVEDANEYDKPKEKPHSLNRIQRKDARGCYSATDAKVMATDNRNVRPKYM